MSHPHLFRRPGRHSAARLAATLTVAALLTTSAAVLTPSAADAAVRHCANRADYRKVHNGQTVAKVQRVLHSKGSVEIESNYSGYRDVIRSFRACGEYSFVSVSFTADPGAKLTVVGKDAYWG